MNNIIFQGLIGVATADITPPVGIYARNWGASQHDISEGVHRPLQLSVVTIQESEEAPPLVMIVADLGWWRSYKDENALRFPILEEFGLDHSRLMISLTHTHAGPVLCRDDSDKAGGQFISPYLERLTEVALETVERALGSAVAGRLEWASGKCTVATNRDLPGMVTEQLPLLGEPVRGSKR